MAIWGAGFSQRKNMHTKNIRMYMPVETCIYAYYIYFRNRREKEKRKYKVLGIKKIIAR